MARRRPSEQPKLSGPSPELSVRPAAEADAAAIAAIHSQGISERTATFETRPSDPGAIAELIAGGALFLVAESGGEVVGFAKAGPYDDRAHYYEGIGEATIFVARDRRGGGAGRALLGTLVDAARDRGLHKLIAKIMAENAASIRLFESWGFRIVGTHHRHGELGGRWLDVVVMERSLQGDRHPGGEGASRAATPSTCFRSAATRQRESSSRRHSSPKSGAEPPTFER